MTPSTSWWWVRHAAVPGATGRIFGQLDLSCDTSDEAAFATLAKRLPIDAVWITSPLCRTHETRAAIVAAGLNAPPAHSEPDFAEQNFGRWQGLTWADMQADDPAAYAEFWTNPVRNAPPGGESYTRQMERVAAAVDRLTDAHAGRVIVCVSHGGTIRAAVAHALALTPEATMAITIDNLSITRLSRVEDGLMQGRGGVWRVEMVNVPCSWAP